MQSFNICSMHRNVFSEIQELLHYSLIELGYSSVIKCNEIFLDRQNIILGVQDLSQEYQDRLPDNCIIFNTEQLDLNSQYEHIRRWTAALLKLGKRFPIWDYNAKNITIWKSQGIDAKLFEFGYQKQLNRLQSQPTQDIDVLFYGSFNERRKYILDQLTARGLKVKILSGVFGEEKDEWIKRSKLVLNMHYFDTHIFEIVRCFYLMTNGVAVVSEVNSSTTIDPRFIDGIAGVPYEQLVDKCVELVNNDLLRKELGYKALHTIS